MRVKFMAALAVVALAGCAPDVSIRHGYDEVTGVTYTNVKSAVDCAGGPRQDLLVATDAHGAIRGTWQAAGSGTCQTATEGAVAAAESAVGTFGAAAAMRPSSTNINNTTSGGSVAAGAAEATATGGRGGAGGRGGNATGGNAVANPVVNATAAGGTGYGGTANAQAGASASNANSNAIHNTNRQQQGQRQNQNQGPQWNCTNSPPCN